MQAAAIGASVGRFQQNGAPKGRGETACHRALVLCFPRAPAGWTPLGGGGGSLPLWHGVVLFRASCRPVPVGAGIAGRCGLVKVLFAASCRMVPSRGGRGPPTSVAWCRATPRLLQNGPLGKGNHRPAVDCIQLKQGSAISFIRTNHQRASI